MSNVGRESEEEVKGMKKATLLTKLGGVAGALAAIFGLIHQLGPVVLGWTMASRDQERADLAGKLAVCEGKYTALEELADGALDASEKRFQQGELHAVELRGGIESLRNEVRIRHGDMSSAPTGFGRVVGAPAAPRRPTRAQALEAVVTQSDQHLSAARRQAPRHTPLRKMIERNEKPEDLSGGTLDF